MRTYLKNVKVTPTKNGSIEVAVTHPDAAAAAAIPANGLRIVYTGTLGAANALGTLIEAAASLRHEPDIHILLVGKGRERAKLEAQCAALGLTNVTFLGELPKSQVQSVLAACDVCYIGWLKSPLYRWGIAANKVPEYLLSCKPIIHGFSGGNDPVAKFKAGITVPAEDPLALADANFVRTLTERQGLQVGSPDEIAYRQGSITAAQLKERARLFEKSCYGVALNAIR